jgi:hypothetical protein
MGFTKSRLLIRWFDPTTNKVKHANAVRFDEYNVPLTSTDKPSPGTLLLQNDTLTDIPSPTTEINLSETPHLQSTIFTLSITIPLLVNFLDATSVLALTTTYLIFHPLTKAVL